MRKELDWIRRQPKARGTKAKYRLDAFQDLKKTASRRTDQSQLQLDVETTRLGKKIIELHDLHKRYDNLSILKGFSYIFKRRERIGIVGRNGVGKSTFLNILTQQDQPDRGEVITGETVVLGYYRQEGIQLAEDKRVIEVVQEIAEYIPLSKGQKLSASQLLDRFLFAPKSQYAYVSTLSGGERRRLYLLTILAKNPNFLILDEPTNDLDILTLSILEDFLADFEGCLLIVTHDRYFMDRLVDHLLVFEGNAVVRDFNGSYSEYRVTKDLEEQEAAEKARAAEKKIPKTSESTNPSAKKTKLSYQEKKEYDALEKEIEQLEIQKSDIEETFQSSSLSSEAIQQKSEELAKIIQLIEQKTDRWLELSEYL
ncbi:MAG: ABC-F family ATP-binding cassette domain-containing protein [Bacteroidia bacterium]|nr:ABC-F family ATP-binding cassette domain-containing protein [Bacteroidia bacterium]